MCHGSSFEIQLDFKFAVAHHPSSLRKDTVSSIALVNRLGKTLAPKRTAISKSGRRDLPGTHQSSKTRGGDLLLFSGFYVSLQFFHFFLRIRLQQNCLYRREK